MRSLLLLAGAALAAASTIVITAGQGGLTFSPDSTTANVGDVLEFHFLGSIHSVIQGSFSDPCMSNGGFDSGLVKNTPAGTGSVFQVTVKDTNPIWFFCGTPTHCQGGMAGVVNPPSGNTIAAYQAAAAGKSSSSGASGPVGGSLVPFPFASSSTPPTSTSTGPKSSSSSPAVPPPSSSPSSVSKPPPSSTPSSVSKPPPSSSPSSVSKPPSSPSAPASSPAASPAYSSSGGSASAVVSVGAPHTTPPVSNATIAGVPPAKSSPAVVTTSGAMSGLALLAVTRSTIVGSLVVLAAGALGLLL